METLSFLIGNYYGSDWAGMILMIGSMYLLGNKQRFGFAVGIGSSIAWFVFGILTGSIPDMIAQIIVVVMQMRGYLRWNTSPQPTL